MSDAHEIKHLTSENHDREVQDCLDRSDVYQAAGCPAVPGEGKICTVIPGPEGVYAAREEADHRVLFFLKAGASEWIGVAPWV